VTVLAGKACALFARVTDPTVPAQRRRLLRGGKLLRRAAARAGRIGTAGAVPDGCTTALVDQLRTTRARAQEVAGLR
jgi:hypothetical protein